MIAEEHEHGLLSHLELLPLAALVFDGQGTLIHGNPAAATLLDGPASALAGTALNERIVPPDRPAFAGLLADLHTQGRGVAQLRFHQPQRAPSWIEVSAARFSEGRFVAYCREIAPQRRGMNDFRLDLAMINHVRAAIYLVRAEDERILHVNPEFEALFGYAGEDIVGRHVSVLNAETEAQRDVARTIIDTLRARGEWRGEVLSGHKDGSTFWCYLSISTFEHAEHGTLWIAARQDISALKATEAEHQRAEAELRASEEKYRNLFSNMTEGFALGEMLRDEAGNAVDFRLIEANEAFFVETGLPRGILEKPAGEYLPGLEDYWRETYESVVRHGKAIRFENFNAATQRHYDLYAFRPSEGRFAVVFRDVTDVKLVEKALQESERDLRQLIATLPGMVWICSPIGAVEFMSQQWLDYTGTTLESQLGFGAFTALHPDDKERVAEEWNRTVAALTPFDSEYRLRRHDGAYRWFKSRGTALLDERGQVIRWLGVVIDIHDLKQTQEALVYSRAKLIESHRLAKFGTWSWNVETGRMELSESVRELYGRDVPPFEAQRGTLLTVDSWERVNRAAAEALRTGKGYDLELEIIHGSGRPLWINSKCQVVRDAAGRIVGLRGAVQDITERKQAEDALRKAEARFRRLSDSNLVAVVIGNSAGQIIEANDHYLDIIDHSREELLAGEIDWRRITPPEWLPADEKALAELNARGVCAPYEKEYVRRDGSRRTVIIFDALLPQENRNILCLAIDITERRQAEKEIARLNANLERQVQERTAQLVHSQKLEAIGQLTGGVAHDFNNVLQGLASALFVLQRYVPKGTPKTLFESAQRSIQNGARLTQAMLAFARRQTLVPESIDLPQMFEDIAPLLERTLGGLVRVAFDAAPDVPPVLADRAQLESALLNLVINARDAMPSGGMLTLRARPVRAGRAGEAGHPAELQPGEYVAIGVEDTGSGIDEATLARVFEPFFTTKPVGSGSGLGLPMVYGMAVQSGGTVAIASAPGRGTTVTLYLPRGEAIRNDEAPSVPVADSGDGSTVLLVDDNDMVREALGMLVETLGYRVIQADGGSSALAILRDGQPVDLLVSDYAMPEMSGAELAREARRVAPHLPVLLITGYAERPDDLDGIQLLHKPFKPNELVASLTALLGQRAAPPA